ncbi:MAG: PH domain-containing protein [Ruminococcus bovis]|nr:PH domain-containing protein [Ruminococcus bovis]MDY3661770.1 PH domain-containing protein [Ruminococcus bovis]
MIDFQNGTFVKLKMVNRSDGVNLVQPLLINGEGIISTYRGIRDYVIFTNKRIISVNVQGMTGKKKDFTSLPYAKISAFSVETAGHFDLDSELELWFSGLGKVKFEFSGNSNIVEIGQIIGSFALN